MKQTVWILACLSVVGLMTACGAENPFERGAVMRADGTLEPQKPEPAGEKKLSKDDFEKTISPMIQNACAGCHGNPAPTFEKASSMVVLGDVANSKLYQKPTGKLGHMAIWEESSKEAKALAGWINGKVEAVEVPATSVAPAQPVTVEPSTPEPTVTPVTPAPVTPAPVVKKLSEAAFDKNVKASFSTSCAKCHANPAPTFAKAEKIVVLGDPSSSKLYLKATGKLGHMALWSETSAQAKALATWIMGE